MVLDRRTADSFNLEVRPVDRALDVFDHPFAYAALHGIATRPSDSRVPTAT
jgi:hypothetical protein